MIPSTLSVRHLRSAEPREPFRRAVPMVRIRFPPAESQVRTCLSREFAFLGRDAAVFRGCPGRDERTGSAETCRRGNIWPKGGDISVGPYSSPAPPAMRSTTMARILSGVRDPDESLTGLALRLQRIEFLIEPLLGGFAGVDRAANLCLPAWAVPA